MRLTLDARLLTASGIGVYIQNLIKSGALRGFDLHLLHRKEDQSLLEELCGSLSGEAYDAKLYSLNEVLQTPRRTRNSDIFWSPHYNVPVVNFASTLRVVTIHDVYHLAYYHTLNVKQKIYAKLMFAKAVRSADLVFTVSEHSRKEIIKFTGCKPEKIKVVHNGVDVPKFQQAYTQEEKQEIRDKYKLPHNYVLFVGNVKPHKNLKNALLGYEKFVKRQGGLTDIKFVIAGRRDGFITGDKEVGDLVTSDFFKDKISFTGWIDDVELPLIYQLASVFIFPSLYEGFGFPPLEAMAAGSPVISSNSSCLTEIYGDSALYFDPESIDEISEALGNVLKSSTLQTTLKEKGLLQCKKYNWEKAIEQKAHYIKEKL